MIDYNQKIIFSGRFNEKDAVIIDLKLMKQHKDYPIIIKGIHMILTKSTKTQLWIREND